MLVIIMLEQHVVGVLSLEAAGSRISMPSSTAPGAWLGHEPGDTKGQQRSQADSRDLAMTSANVPGAAAFTTACRIWHARGQGLGLLIHDQPGTGSSLERASQANYGDRTIPLLRARE
jgi:hypothetical protein